ncbi:NDP-hexose 2,3-dehydratase family protein [Streptomyces sp. NRRL F-5727]|uniref:NDP-hexose 2,3-dehydratase family protein n=1 Tax=Streptomyces sp. NRRL F-5727 TaxID=1463871 RepID=UPI00068DB955|nr:NDP-hexose 2,3-dehydratase family protein [Streptomyces sp. NRRL F-5727]
MFSDLAAFHGWFADRCTANAYRVRRVPLEDLEGWSTEAGSGDLVHGSGRFFSVRGLDVTHSGREVDSWQQPIIVQPEHGILGILVKEFDGVPHCLLQAKMEPGNVNLVQLSPTVQATKSNYTRVHGGRAVPYLEHFVAPRGGQVLFDALQSEQASWFLSKRNRNMIVRTEQDVPLLEDFCWLTFDQIAGLLRVDDLVNMDTRTVLSGAVALLRPRHRALGGLAGEAVAGAWETEESALHTTTELLSWFTEAKGAATLTRRLMPLSDVAGWSARDGVIAHDEGRHFTVLGVAAEAPSREVARWTQPMFAPRSQGVIAFLTRRVAGVPHVLVQARTETGALDRIEMAPTVQCQPADHTPPHGLGRPPFLDEVLGARPDRILLDVVLSEEGGRFYHARSRYLVVEADDDFPLDVPPDFAWVTLRQLTHFVRFGSHLNVEARSLLTLLGFVDEGARAAGLSAGAVAR